MYYEEFVKNNKIKDIKKEKDKNDIITSIVKTKLDLENSRRNYNFAEGDLIDYYLYQIKANQSKLDYLIKEAKSKNIMLDIVDKIKYNIV